MNAQRQPQPVYIRYNLGFLTDDQFADFVAHAQALVAHCAEDHGEDAAFDLAVDLNYYAYTLGECSAHDVAVTVLDYYLDLDGLPWQYTYTTATLGNPVSDAYDY